MAAKLPAKLFKRRSLRQADNLVELIQQRDEDAVISLLASRKAKVNATNKYGQTPLCAAVTFFGNNTDIVMRILDGKMLSFS